MMAKIYKNVKVTSHIHYACKAGSYQNVMACLERGANPNSLETESGDSPLLVAVMKAGNKEIIELLLRRGADPNLANLKGWTSLHMISNARDEDSEKKFFDICLELNRPLAINAQDKSGRTPLHYALLLKRMKLSVFLLRIGANPNLANVKRRWTPLHIICHKKYEYLAKILFQISDKEKRPVAINAQDRFGRSPLYLTLNNGHMTLAELLLRRGADPYMSDKIGLTPQHVICNRNLDDAVSVLLLFQLCEKLNRPLQVDTLDHLGRTPLHFALSNGLEKVAKLLLERGADPNVANMEGSTPLHIICNRDEAGLENIFFEICDKLGHLIQVNVQDKFGRSPLYFALNNGHMELAELLLNRGADLYMTDEIGLTPLHVMCNRNLDDAVSVQLFFDICNKFNHPLQIDARDKTGRTPLHLALKNGLMQVTEFLLNQGANLYTTDKKELTSLHFICNRNLDDAVSVQRFFEICNKFNYPLHIDAQDKTGRTPLHLALKKGLMQVTEFLLNQGANLYTTDEKGLTSLHVICNRNLDDAVSVQRFFEICNKFNYPLHIDAQDKTGRTPLLLNLINGHKKVAKLLLERGADPNVTNIHKLSPLHIICYRHLDDVNFVRLFFKICHDKHHMIQIDAKEKHGWSPLHLSIDRDNKRVTKLLLERGADPNVADLDGFTPLHVICESNYGDSWDMFLKICDKLNLSLHVNAQDKYGETPLHSALKNGHKKLAELLLLNLGADLTLVNMLGTAPLHLISHIKDKNFLRLIFKNCVENDHKLQIDVLDKHGRTPLYSALGFRNKELAKLLLRKGANPNLADDKGSTPLHIICYKDNTVKGKIAEEFFKINDCRNQQLLIDAQDIVGNTPLHHCVHYDRKQIFMLLLKRGANPNVANINKLTPLHIISMRKDGDSYMKPFFEIYNDKQQIVQVNVQNQRGWTPLHFALTNGHRKMCELLLRNGADPNVATNEGWTPLHIICKRDDDDDELAKLFFQKCDEEDYKIQINAQDECDRTPLFLALESANKKVAKFLLRNDANPNLVNSKKLTPLHIICNRDLEDVDFLCQFFQICHEKDHILQVDAQDDSGRTPLLLALESNNIKVAKFLLEKGANPNLPSEEFTPLHTICTLKDDNFIELFFEINHKLKKKVQVDAPDFLGRSPLQLALQFGLKKVTEFLLRNGADPNLASKEGTVPLHVICNQGDDVELLKLFFNICNEERQILQIDALDKSNRTPLYFALDAGHKKVAEFLLTECADPNLAKFNGLSPLQIMFQRNYFDLAEISFQISDIKQRTLQVNVQDEFGRTLLHYAMNEGQGKLAESLLKRGADPNLSDQRGFTPLHIISNKDDEALAKMLFKIGAELNKSVQDDIQDHYGRTPLHLALDRGHKVAGLLLRRGVNPNTFDKIRLTPLHIICNKDDDVSANMFFEICKELNQPIQVNVQDYFGRTPLHFALNNSQMQLAELLLKEGADPCKSDGMGLTPLHVICTRNLDDAVSVQLFFDICNKLNQPLQIDAQNKSGWTPLHFALNNGLKNVTELLLKQGADPNVANMDKLTPLHVICDRNDDNDDLLKLFLKINEEKNHPLQVDAKDKIGRTPLSLALERHNKNVARTLSDFINRLVK